MKKIIVLLVLVLVLAGCSATPTAAPTEAVTPPAELANPQMFLVVQRQDGMVIGFSRAEFDAMQQTTLNVAGVERTGVSLKEILLNCEVAGFQVIYLRGEPVLAITSEELTDNMIIYADDQAILRFAATEITPLTWPDQVQYVLIR